MAFPLRSLCMASVWGLFWFVTITPPPSTPLRTHTHTRACVFLFVTCIISEINVKWPSKLMHAAKREISFVIGWVLKRELKFILTQCGLVLCYLCALKVANCGLAQVLSDTCDSLVLGSWCQLSSTSGCLGQGDVAPAILGPACRMSLRRVCDVAKSCCSRRHACFSFHLHGTTRLQLDGFLLNYVLRERGGGS